MQHLLQGKTLVLASKSPRRSQLLSEAGIPFLIRTKEVAETYPPDMKKEDIAEFLAVKKASAFRNDIGENEILLTADTVVIKNDKLLGKPKDKAEAVRMLQSLSGTIHQVITGVCLLSIEKEVRFSVSAEVKFNDLSDEEIEYYIESCQPYDKAGAYGIQEWIGHCKIEWIKGTYATIMGLPVHRVYQALKAFI